MTIRRGLAIVSLVAASSATATMDARCQERSPKYSGWGPRVGIRMNPDQIYGGAHINAGRIFDRVRYQPSAEIGAGDNLLVITINALEATYRFAKKWEVWSPYLGGGLGVVIVDADGRSSSKTDVGMSVVGGIEKGLGSGDSFFIETRLGLVDQPDLGLGVGWIFR